MHTHVVFFWLKDQRNRATFKAGLTQLVKDPMVKQFTIGEPAQTSRAVVENGYDFGLIAEFENLTTHDAYQKGAHHLQFLEDCKDLWSAVQVYDVET